ncbi:prevent-host-death protein [Microbacterium sp. No. 7]|nr:prevent-host-death protein [Microbacterium sp. No. 7]
MRDVRNQGGRVLDEVARGSTFIVTRDGAPIAELRPIRRKGLSAAELIARRRMLPDMEPDTLRRDIDMIVDMTL